MIGNAPDPAPLGSLLRKAAADAGFNLEPERDSSWWKLRASGELGVAWIRTLPGASGVVVALPLATQLAELGIPEIRFPVSAPKGDLTLPLSAAGAVICASPDAVYAALRRVWRLRAHAPERLRAKLDADVAQELAQTNATTVPSVTEVMAQVRRRIGQNLFREALLDYWDGQCAVTGLAIPELLRASHAKPWAVASDFERLDVHNGFLLAVHLDAMFDGGLITFDDDGRVVASARISPSSWAIIGLHPSKLRLRRVHAEHLSYLAYHRAHVFEA